MPKEVSLAYGKEKITVSVPESAAVLEPAATGRPGTLPESAIEEALRAPIGSGSLPELLRDRRPETVAIIISDITRAVPNRVFMPVILQQIEEAGIPREAVTIIVGTGMHRPSTPEEHLELLGEEVVSTYEVLDHKADEPESLVQVSDDPYVAVNRRFAEADFRIVTGFIEPHFMAGYSGGRKGVCPALVDLRTIQRFHGYETLADPRAKEGVLQGNPCHETALAVARTVGVDFLLNVAINDDKEIIGVYAGELEAAHQRGCEDVAEWTGCDIHGPYDIVITHGGGYPLDQNFYQTVKGMCLALPALHEESTLLLLSSCAQQLGSPEYTELMKRYSGKWKQFLSHAAARPDRTDKDQWELQLQSRVLKRIGQERLLFFTDDMEEQYQRVASVTPVLGTAPVGERLQQKLDELLATRPDASVAVIPGGPYTILRRTDASP